MGVGRTAGVIMADVNFCIGQVSTSAGSNTTGAGAYINDSDENTMYGGYISDAWGGLWTFSSDIPFTAAHKINTITLINSVTAAAGGPGTFTGSWSVQVYVTGAWQVVHSATFPPTVAKTTLSWTAGWSGVTRIKQTASGQAVSIFGDGISLAQYNYELEAWGPKGNRVFGFIV